MDLRLLVLHAEPPVGIASRKPSQRGDFGDLVVIEDLEDRVVEVQAIGAGVVLGLELDGSQVGGKVVGVDGRHGSSPLEISVGSVTHSDPPI